MTLYNQNTVRSVFDVYVENLEINLILRNCFELKMFFLRSDGTVGNAVANIFSPYVNSSNNGSYIVFPSASKYELKMVAPSPSLLINDSYKIILKNMDRQKDQFIIQQQIIVNDEPLR